MGKKGAMSFKIIMIILFVFFISVYIAGNSGYYDYEAGKKAKLTAEKMKEFEEDVKAGKNVDVTSYLEDTHQDYRSDLSNFCYKATQQINKYTKKGIESMLRFINKMVDE